MNHPHVSDFQHPLLSRLRRIAKMVKGENPEWKLAQAQDLVATRLHFQNWSLLHKNFAKATSQRLAALQAVAMADSVLASYFERTELLAVQSEPLDEEAACDEMEEWVRSTYTPLIQFAFYDSEAENGFAWPEEDLFNDLQEEFGDKYPIELIEKVAQQLESSEGPWGIEDYGSDDE